MSSVVNFVRRNKYKIVIGGIAVGGAVALAEKIWQSSEEAKKYSNGHVKEEVNANTALRNEVKTDVPTFSGKWMKFLPIARPREDDR